MKLNTNNEFLIRSLSSIFIVISLMSFIYVPSITFSTLFIFIVGMLINIEWMNITSKSDKKNFWMWLGIGYASLTTVPLINLKLHYGSHMLMWLFLLVWCVDTFAYIVCKILKLGKHRITTISPKKSYEGLFGGMIGASIICYIFANIFLPDISSKLLIITPLLCILEQTSDIIESYIKRKFNVKDSGSIIPGHGGIMDRFDGFLLTTPVLILFLLTML